MEYVETDEEQLYQEAVYQYKMLRKAYGINSNASRR